MSFIDAVNQTDRLLSLIRRHATGRPEHLAHLLGVDKRTVLRYIAHLKEEGFPITFCSNRESYVFTAPVQYEFKIVVDKQPVLAISGGTSEL